jgi:ubiquinone/menaquinone biosynthesis C-methylase UbiE
MTVQSGVPAEFFDEVYDGEAPWDVHMAQPAIVAAAAAGLFAGDILDVGCGTGDNAIHLAQQGLKVVAIDFVPKAMAIARFRAAQAGVTVDWREHDALYLRDLDQQFDVVLDSAVFHVFNDADREQLIAGLKTVTKPGGILVLLCFSDARPPVSDGPRRVSEAELRAAFATGWTIRSLEPSVFVNVADPAGAPAWLAVIERNR